MAIAYLKTLLEAPLLLIALLLIPLLLIPLLLIPLLRILLGVPPIPLLRVPAISMALVVMVVTKSQNPEPKCVQIEEYATPSWIAVQLTCAVSSMKGRVYAEGAVTIAYPLDCSSPNPRLLVCETSDCCGTVPGPWIPGGGVGGVCACARICMVLMTSCSDCAGLLSSSCSRIAQMAL